MMKRVRTTILLVAMIGAAAVPASAMLVAGDGGIGIIGELHGVRSTSETNLISITIPFFAFHPTAQIDFMLFAESGELLSQSPMVMNGLMAWNVTFRSTTNPFTHFGSSLSNLLDLPFSSLLDSDLNFEMRFNAGDMTTPLALPDIAAFVGSQAFESIAFSRGPGPRAIVQNLAFIPEPSCTLLMALAFVCILTRRNPLPQKADAGNGSDGIWGVIDATRSPSPDPER